MTPEQAALPPLVLERVGRALHGEQWRTPLARDLGMSERSLRYLVSGERRISPGVARDLAAIIEARQDDLAALADLLREAAAGG